MARSLNLRQIEAFKVVIEKGTVSRAAETLFVSQPAVSKLLAHLEMDTGLQLFDRVRGRLIPTPQAHRLYGEIERIFNGIRQVERAVEAIRREERGQIVIGVAPALSGAFIQQATKRFMAAMPRAMVHVQGSRSNDIRDLILSRSIDIGLSLGSLDHPEIDAVPLLEQPLACIMPRHHPLAVEEVVAPHHLDRADFVAFRAGGYTRRRIDEAFAAESVAPNIVLEASAAPTVSEFVASGLGVALIHPVLALEHDERIAVRPYRPAVLCNFTMGRNRGDARSPLVDAFFGSTAALAAEVVSTRDRI